MADCPVCYKTISELHKMIRSKSISPLEVVKIFLDRIAELNPKMNAYCHLCGDEAVQQAIASGTAISGGYDLGLLHGIPYAAKDLYNVAGMPTTAGTSLLKHNIAGKDATVIKKLKESGMILLGKTNTVQFAYGGVGINHDMGTPLNPWKKDSYVAGGSSSGSAVSVSSGFSPAALGTDTGGSIRIPASLCGITGLKPTAGRISRYGIYPLSYTMDSFGPLTRSAEDAAIVYERMQGEDANDPSTYNLPKVNILENLERGIKGFNLAFPKHVFWDNAHADVERAVRSTESIFRDLGAGVGEVDFPLAKEANDLNSKSLIISSEACVVNQYWINNHFDQLDPAVAQRMINGTRISAVEYIATARKWKELQIRVMEEFDHIDGLIVPTTCIPALPVDHIDKDLNMYFHYNTLYLRNTAIGNILNLCAISVPCGFTEDGLPIGLMIYGKPYREDIILRIAYAFQKNTDWHTRVPGV